MLEVNTQPGLTQNSLLLEMAKSEGINFYELCEILIKNSICEKFLIIPFSFLLIFFIYKIFFYFDNTLFFSKLEKKVHKIVIHNLDNINEEKILRKITLKEGHSFWDFNSKQLSDDLKKIRGIFWS